MYQQVSLTEIIMIFFRSSATIIIDIIIVIMPLSESPISSRRRIITIIFSVYAIATKAFSSAIIAYTISTAAFIGDNDGFPAYRTFFDSHYHDKSRR